MNAPAPAPASLPSPADAPAARAVIAVGAVFCLLGAVVIGLFYDGLQPLQRGLAVSVMLAMAAVLGALAAWTPQRWLRPGAAAALTSCVIGVLLVSAVSGQGLHSTTMPTIAMFVMVAGLLAGWRAAAAITLLALAGTVGLLLMEQAGMLPGAAAPAAASVTNRAMALSAIILCGLGLAWAFAIYAHRHQVLEARAREATESSERRWRSLFARSPSALLLHREGIVIAANEAAARLFGFEHPELMCGQPLLDLYDDASRPLVHARLALFDALPEGETLPMAEFSMRRADGQHLFVHATGARVHLPDGPAIESVYVDVTERRTAEKALLRSQALLTELFSSSPDIVTVTEPETGRYILVNPSLERRLGYRPEEVLGRTVIEVGVLPSQAERQRFLEIIRRDGSVQDYLVHYRAKDGRLVPCLISGTIFHVDGTPYLLVLTRDVSERLRSRAEYQAILDNAPVGIAVVQDGRFEQANAKLEHMLGWETGTLTGLPVSAIWPSEEEFQAVRARAAEALARDERVDIEHEMARRDGSRFWSRMRASRIDDGHLERRSTLWILEDVTETRRTARDLAIAKEEAEAASRAKSMFLANMSHEIRTPLHGVLGLAQLALSPGVHALRREEYLRRIVDSAQSLSGIISDILDLSKIEAGRLQLEHLSFDLHELLRGLYQSYRELAASKGLRLDLRVGPGVPRQVMGDPLRLRQILGNYLSNALKFTERGSIEILAATTERTVRLAVRDQGPGIEPGLRDRLFQPFTQADESISRRYGGTGLGLSICRELARLMGGQVGVESQPGAGALFWLELPLPASTAHERAAPPALSDGRRLRGARVLVVEDNPVNMMIAVAMLERWGIEVVPSGDGRDALAKLEAANGRFDAVLMDLHMPAMSGYEVTRRARERWDAHALPIIALTAAALVSEQERALEAGMNDFIPKPIDMERLYAALARWVRCEGSSTVA
ncbi:MAG TPA: PAS domain S-box protein [Burkholderiaceae bacterium]|nr:PAS domain S-box protein [Burkholderiaceae bacterium]